MNTYLGVLYKVDLKVFFTKCVVHITKKFGNRWFSLLQL